MKLEACIMQAGFAVGVAIFGSMTKNKIIASSFGVLACISILTAIRMMLKG